MSTQQPRVLAIIGQGYVGLPLAMAAVDAGWTVIGIDNIAAKVAQINGGSSPVEDISDKQLQTAISIGAYKATTDFSEVAQASSSLDQLLAFLHRSHTPSPHRLYHP